MPSQSYENHRQLVPAFHFVLLGLLAAAVLGALVNLFQSFGDSQKLTSALLLLVLTLSLVLVTFLSRIFALKSQDRAIRAEENLRHLVLTGKLLDPRLSIRQIIALRFASDSEFASLARQAAENTLSPDAVKRAVKQWRPDYHRV